MGASVEKRILELLKAGRPFLAATVVEREDGGEAGARALVLPDGTLEGTLGSAEWDVAAASEAHGALEKGPRTFDFGSAKVFLDPHRADPRMIVCGAGHIALPLSKFAIELGFGVTVVDDREDFAAPERFPGCATLFGEYGEVLPALEYGPETAVVVVTRGHTYDIECLLPVLKKDAGYVGLIGSRRRVGFVKKELLAQGADPARVADLFTPIGLDIGGESPAEIAVSIIAEIIALRRLGRARTLVLRNRGEAR